MVRDGYRSPGWSASGYLNIFEGSYGDGETRVLAQEPVQNSKDARSGNEIVRVEYRLMRDLSNDGKPFHMLTVTDTGTTGLCGKTNPSPVELQLSTDEEREDLKWYHFERLFDSNKNQLHSGSRGWGKSIFLKCSRIPEKPRSAMMIYDSLLEDGEYRFSDMTIWDDDFGVRDEPLLNDDARRAVSDREYRTPDGNISVPLALEPLSEPGTRIIVPYLSESTVASMRDGSLANWLQYLWWRPITEGYLTISIVDDESDSRRMIAEPKWWEGDILSGDATTPGNIHDLYPGCHIQILEDEDLGEGCTVKRLALYYDAKLRDQPKQSDGPDYAGVQIFRAGQCIETIWEFSFIPQNEKHGFRAFVEFDLNTDRKLRDKENSQHTRLRRSGIVKRPILLFLQEKVEEFARGIGLIKSRDLEDGAPSEAERRTIQFVFDRLLGGPAGDLLNETKGDLPGEETDKPWEVDVLLNYPNPKTSRVDWGQRISNIRFVVNSHPETFRRNTRYVIEWQAPGVDFTELLSRPAKGNQEYGLAYRVLTQHEVEEHHIICPEPGIYRIRAAVYEGKRLVAKKARRIHVQMDPPERQENLYAVSISVENETAPGELRIENGDILRLQINGRNRTHDDVSGQIFVRMKEGTVLLSNKAFTMPGKPLGGDDRRHMLHHMRIRVVRGEPAETLLDNGVSTLTLESGLRVIQAYLLDDGEELAYGPRTLHFESEPAQKQGSIPFELFKVIDGNIPPMWELKLAESKLRFPADYPLYTELSQKPASDSTDVHNAFTLEITVNGLLEWALDPLLENESDPTNIEALRNGKPDLVDDDAWDRYIDGLSKLEFYMKQFQQDHAVSPVEFALIWRQTVAAAHRVLLPQENN